MKKSSVREASVILEACPPALDDRDKAYAVLRQSFTMYNSFHVISIPDLQDEGEFKRSRDRVPNEEFAKWLHEVTSGCPSPARRRRRRPTEPTDHVNLCP